MQNFLVYLPEHFLLDDFLPDGVPLSACFVWLILFICGFFLNNYTNLSNNVFRTFRILQIHILLTIFREVWSFSDTPLPIFLGVRFYFGFSSFFDHCLVTSSGVFILPIIASTASLFLYWDFVHHFGIDLGRFSDLGFSRTDFSMIWNHEICVLSCHICNRCLQKLDHQTISVLT